MSTRPVMTWSFREAVRPGIDAVRRHWPPLVVIQVAAVALVISYYRLPGLRAAAHHASDLKVRYGVWFAFALGMLAGGVVPELAKLVTGDRRRFDRTWLADSTFNSLVYGVVGVQVDLFYRLQAFTFGPDHGLKTLIVKTAVDMGLFAPIISIPTATLLYAWRRERFQIRRVLGDGLRPFFLKQIMPGLIPCWFFWTPVLFCTYGMPPNLQLCFSMLAEAAWSIVFIFIAKQDHASMP
ncbi:MAG: hypothetical protein ACYC96_04355 [Fimbriimonadaceae bacterium]